MSLDDEFEGFAAETDDFFASDYILTDDNDEELIVRATVSDFQTMRELDTRQNLVLTNRAHVIVNRESNPQFSIYMDSRELDVPVNGWTFRFKHSDCMVSNASADEISWEFDIEDPMN